jgi:DNA-directed RNA polymerase specialized sigma24 family protein
MREDVEAMEVRTLLSGEYDKREALVTIRSGAGGVDAADWVTEENLDQILTLDEAICRIEQRSPEQAQVVRLRFYGGLRMEDVATVMGSSEATVKRLWRYARAWLWRELKSDSTDSTA